MANQKGKIIVEENNPANDNILLLLNKERELQDVGGNYVNARITIEHNNLLIHEPPMPEGGKKISYALFPIDAPDTKIE